MTDTPLPSPDLSTDSAAPNPGSEAPETVHEDRLWRDGGWTARVIKNEDDDGWAVEMIKDGEPEPALTLDIVPDEDEPYALLSALDAAGEQLAQVRVSASFNLSKASAAAWVENEFRRPG